MVVGKDAERGSGLAGREIEQKESGGGGKIEKAEGQSREAIP